jgi:hypothetical protein
MNSDDPAQVFPEITDINYLGKSDRHQPSSLRVSISSFEFQNQFCSAIENNKPKRTYKDLIVESRQRHRKREKYILSMLLLIN